MAQESGSVSDEQPQSWVAKITSNVELRRKTILQEISGSLGDLGTFVPIVLALALVNNLDLGTTLIFTGIYNVVTGCLFGVPMPVQPMKSIAAVAITEGNPLTIPQIMSAGLSTAFVLLFLGVTGLMSWVQWLVPLSVVRGIQLSQGLSFGQTAVKYMLKEQNFATGKSPGDRPWLGLDGRILALVGFSFVVLVTGAGGPSQREHHRVQHVKRRIEQWLGREEEGEAENAAGGEGEESRPPHKAASSLRAPLLPTDSTGENQDVQQDSMIPSALIVFFLGVVLAFVRDPSIFGQLKWGPSPLQLVRISWTDWKIGFLRGAIPQLPLSVLNSVIAVVKLSEDLFPLKTDVTAFAVSTSVGLMNIVGCWFGAMPVCHGAGGLAGQYRFGARNGLSVVLLGTAKLVIGLVLGTSLVKVLSSFPIGLLGVLLVFAGIELAMACRDQNTRQEAFVMLITAVASLASSAAFGFVCGLFVVLLLKGRAGELELRRRVRSLPGLR